MSVIKRLVSFQCVKSSAVSFNRGCFKGCSGIHAKITKKSGNSDFHCRIELKGLYFSLLRVSDLEVLRYLSSSRLSIRFTRVDLALDDYRRDRKSLISVARVARLGNFKYFQVFEVQFSAYRCSGEGYTVYFGRKGKSDKLLRYYDCSYVHDLDCNRWELQLRRDRAIDAIDQLLQGVSIADLLTGSIDFGVTDSHRDFTRFSWWQAFIEAAGPAFPSKVSPKSLSPDLERALSWINDQCAPTLEVIRRVYGANALADFIRQSSLNRLKNYHSDWIDYLRKNEIKLCPN